MFTAPLAVFGPFLDYFRPSRSPYLLAVLAATVLICVLCATGKVAHEKSNFVFLPAYIILVMMVAFSLAFKGAARDRAVKRMIDIGLSKVLHPIHDKEAIETLSASIGESVGLVVIDEADSQFRFARTFGISASILTIYALFFVWSKDVSAGWTLWTTYAACLITLFIFSVFTLGNLNNVEPHKDSPLFQVAIVTVSMVVASAFIQEKTVAFAGATICDWEYKFIELNSEKSQTETSSCLAPPKIGESKQIYAKGVLNKELEELKKSLATKRTKLDEQSKTSPPEDADQSIKDEYQQKIDSLNSEITAFDAQITKYDVEDFTTNVSSIGNNPPVWINYYLFSWALFILLWLLCAIYWLNRMRLEFRFDIGRRE